MKKELELYLHIPFCVKKCAYCDFLSAPADEDAKQEYVNALLCEIQGYEAYHESYQVTTIFMGGGTPSLLTGDQVIVIFDALHQSFQIAENAEVTIEANPGTVTKEKLKAWKAAGINRLSIGLQSADNEELKMLGRIHTWEEFLTTYDLARKQGFDNINIDLISAIPGQTEASWKKTLTKAARLDTEHISAYSLMIEEGTPFYERYGENAGQGLTESHAAENTAPLLPDEDAERKIYEMTAEILSEYGYQRYEISNYAKEGYACRHNMGYWERKEYLGIGLGASSLIGRSRYHNTGNIRSYIQKVQEKADIKEDVEQLSVKDEIEEFMFLGLRKTKGISISGFEELYRQSIFDVYGTQMKKLMDGGLLEMSEDRIRLTEKGIDVSNLVFLEFMG
ncbi:oxygen-independent coproporphyrinogen III oxidase [Eubacterium sp. am_0171]|uniref:radical SAM family heme chaperone HemW n=1 Tax=unclassified Eubacterium (in: firmicutes) TaxID=2624479 RepID=UPI00101F6D79|nr:MULTISPECIES: radical SAM family heme chaperone HemW [unclassified Eubacterium (in: firmicutes)]MSC86368.1 oxygen-independent coproporphyrinogen III oxidase [Eubacterium sp. BIOML-A1]MSD07682.1 oxygen-independent coproporphyrinogen III oxidase [Eubacterium sp. BIOML-A2]RYT14167.1 oxygen-independent coproporphyrinogen III oxidase [Eubacterium sp. am_0171]